MTQAALECGHPPVVSKVVDDLPTLRKSGRLLELDALRGIAALMVVFYHFTSECSKLGMESFQTSWGGLGVQLFFVISGYVILLSLERCVSLKDFAISRFGRLFPAYWVACAVVIALFCIRGWPSDKFGTVATASNFTMLQSFVGLPSLSGVFWTLHVEMAFYVFIACLFALGAHRHAAVVMGIVIVAWWVAIATLSIDEFAFSSTPHWLKYARMGFPLLFHHLHPMPFFLLGVALYNARSGWSIANLICAGIAVADIAWHTVAHRPHLEWVILATLLLLAFTATRGGAQVLRFRPLVFIGVVSYSLYLLHSVVGELLIGPVARITGNANLAVIASAIVAVAVAAAAALIVEQPAYSAIRSAFRGLRKTGNSLSTQF